jgi:hypothetical protein
MKKLIVLILVLTLYSVSFAQNSDLIVTTEGDSIACEIEQVTDSVIFVRMLTDNEWVRKMYKSDQIEEYKMDLYYRNQLVFKEGSTSLIESVKEIDVLIDSYRNTFTLESNLAFNSVNYCRLIPLKDHNRLSVGAGINYFAFGFWWASAESTILIGKTRHFFEAGVEVNYPFEDIPGFTIVGYRFQGYNGLILKANLHLIFPMVAIGYSF